VELTGFIGGAYKLQSASINCQRCVNLYPQLDESGTGKNVAALLGTPGTTLFATLDAAKHPVRGMLATAKGRLFAVTFTTLWEVMSNGTAVNRGTLLTSNGFVGIADNGQQLMLVDGLNGYQFDLSTNMLTMLSGFPGGVTVTFQDGYFIFNQGIDSQVFWITDAYSTTINPTWFESAEGSPDTLRVVLSDNKSLLWLFGTSSTEVWYDSGAQAFPYARIQGGVIPFGLAADRTPCLVSNTVAWLGNNAQGQGVAYLANGLNPQRVSTHAMEQEWATYSTIADGTSYTYQQDGHEFWVINFPSGNATWVYDVSTQLWHQRAFTGVRGLERARGDMHVEAFGKHIISDWQYGKLYVLDRFALNDVGTPISRIRTTPYTTDQLKNMRFSKLQLDMQVGLGPGNAPIGNPAPQCMMKWSDTSGKTWSNEYWKSLGAVGEYNTRVIWRRLGLSRQRVFEFTITDDVLVAINNAYIEVSEGWS